MATKDLPNLIKCCNYAGTSGQTFRDNVTGAVSGTWMIRDHTVTGLDWTGGPAGADVFPQDTGHVYSMTGSFIGGSHIGYIIRQGSGLFAISNVTINAGGSVSLDSSDVSGSSASASVTIIAPYNPGATESLSGSATYYYSGTDQASPPSSGYCQAHFSAVVTGGGGTPDGGYDNVEFDLAMSNVNAYTGDFNVTPAAQHFVAATNHRGVSPSDMTVEWHDNSSYTHYVSGAFNYFVDESVIWPTAPDPSGYTLWLRYQLPGGGSWVNFGAVTFIDSRIMY